ncbi:efflux RND transporter periplasmic adaptor subunit [Umezawaea beigongshangensis]|uniref:efflux RND transporter periplasmic adaptor subunit n=1 Tax=Umezawaea beigongshangensis TaxID=2780383 RepID=UPI0018F17D2C|nr:efflux RND transporter periplasmic adaptor subunit [Umezawaea beigongshangensis]
MVRKHILFSALGLVAVTATACTSSGSAAQNPELAPRGTTMTTAEPTRQDLTNRISLTGKVEMNPVFGVVSPVDGEVRYLEIADVKGTPTVPTGVANIWAAGRPTRVDVPAGATFAARLVDDRADVTAGMPIASAKHGGYAIVAQIDDEQAYKVSDALASVQAQIKNGPGPFPCAVLGTIAALPAGTVAPAPEAPADDEAKTAGEQQPEQRQPEQRQPDQRKPAGEPTASSGLRVVCTAPADVKLINGASAALDLVTAEAKNVLVVPVEAVAGSQGRGRVDVLATDGSRKTTDVELGLTDGKVVEIRSGLTGNEKLAVPGPDLPPGTASPQDGPISGAGQR